MSLSVQCPRCNGAVSIAEEAAGKRVRCPHCEATFLAPGVVATESDDDDWLNLDDAPVAPLPTSNRPTPSKPSASKPTKPAASKDDPNQSGKPAPSVGPGETGRSSTGPRLSEEDEALLAEFANDLDDFTAEIETPPPPHPSAAATPAAPPPGSPSNSNPGSHTPSKPAAGSKPVADEVVYATEYRVPCNVCGSYYYAKANQAGRTVKCGDCYSPITIPPPPRVRRKQNVDIANAETFTFEESKNVKRGPDPYQRSATELLEEASREDEVKRGPVYDDVPSVKEWFRNVFGIFRDPGVLMHWLVLSTLGAVPTVLALQMDSPLLMLGLFPAGFFLAVLLVCCGFAILEAVANEEERVSEWPTLDPMGWLGQLFVALAAACVAIIPIWSVCMAVIGPSLFSVAATMLSVYVLFPFVLLSMLDMNSPLVPFSSEVARSVTKCEEAWGGFYFSSGILFVVLFLLFTSVGALGPSIGAVVAITATVGATFSYFSMIGRLAYAIGQAVNAPPRHDENLDRTRHNDVA